MSIIVLLIGCIDEQEIVDKYKDVEQHKLNQQADHAFSKHDYKKAAELYEALANYHPGAPVAKKAQLRAMYAYAKLKKTLIVESMAEEFLHQYPREKEASYAYYLLSMAPLFDHSSFLQRAVDAKPELRGAGLLNKSFKRFRAMLRLYPKSPYVPQAKLILLNIKRLIAMHESNIAQYYYNKGAYQAAINRAMDSLEVSLSVDSAIPALKIMQAGFVKIGNADEAAKVKKVLQYNKVVS